MANAQASDEELQALLSNNELSLLLKPLSTDPTSSKLYCDIRNDIVRPYVPASFRKTVFQSLHNLSHLANFLGVQKIRTTPYQPSSNGIVERFHRFLKQSLRCHASTKWTESIPLVLLGLGTALKEDLQCTSAELVYGSTLKLPAEFFETPSLNVEPHQFLKNLQNVMDQLKPVSTASHDRQKVSVHPALGTCTHVFVRHYAVKKSLQAQYDGPYCVLRRTDKTFTIEKNGKESTINIDRVKPAFFENSHQSSAPTTASPPLTAPSSMQSVPEPSPSIPASRPNSSPPPYVTRSGRRVHFNPRYL
ncbi:hypothetical protein AVEN_165329-1 [Araneus ventricosus]|uniref:Integrase catalytic domain-containing protein n=1 Tax=Araneus ventricosus TaxID=182803 RepID=A0A4Y2ATF1_ARAVE|nr:hypothetical protein AVEN_165329-1 [Araneus ventricosus]